MITVYTNSKIKTINYLKNQNLFGFIKILKRPNGMKYHNKCNLFIKETKMASRNFLKFTCRIQDYKGVLHMKKSLI